MAEARWFAEEELRDMSRPTMDRAIEALDRGDVDAARELCEEMKHEWRFMHDLMAGGLLGLISFVQEKLGDEGVAQAWRYGNERGWRGDVEKIDKIQSLIYEQVPVMKVGDAYTYDIASPKLKGLNPNGPAFWNVSTK